MRKSLWAILTLTASAGFADDYWCLNRIVTITTEYTYLRRQELHSRSVVKEVPEFVFLNEAVPGTTVLSTGELEKRLGWESGVRAGLTIHGTACSSFEFLYTYIWPWEAHKSVHAHPGNVLRYPFKDFTQTKGFIRARRVDADYKSWLQNGEATFWGHVTPQRCNYFSFSWNLGLRIMWLNEDFVLDFIRHHRVEGTHMTKTNNVLYGLQAGAMLEMNPDSCWTWTFLIKGAGFFNVAQNKLRITEDEGTVLLRHYTKNRWTDSWLLEGYGQLAYHFSSYLSIHFGYQGYILTGVALAPEQRDVRLRSHRHLKDDGQIVIDGLYTGFEFNF